MQYMSIVQINISKDYDRILNSEQKKVSIYGLGKMIRLLRNLQFCVLIKTLIILLLKHQA